MRIFLTLLLFVAASARADLRCWPRLKGKVDRQYDRPEISTLVDAMSSDPSENSPTGAWLIPSVPWQNDIDKAYDLAHSLWAFKAFRHVMELVDWHALFHGEVPELKKVTWTSTSVLGRPWNLQERDVFWLALTHAKQNETVYVSFLLGPLKAGTPGPDLAWGANPMARIERKEFNGQEYLLARWLKFNPDAIGFLIRRVQDRYFDR